MPDSPALDLANLDNWFGLRPGMTRVQVTERLQQLGTQEDLYSDSHTYATVGEHEVEFFYTTDASERVRQISLDGDEILWNRRRIAGVRFDVALNAMEPFGRTPMWQATDATDDSAPESIPAGPISDEQLLEGGTLWQLDRGLGLVMCAGEVIAIAWREPRDLPTQLAGPLTDTQRELSKRPDLEKYLREKQLERGQIAAPKNPLAPVHVLLVMVCIGLLAAVGKKGFEEMKLWNQAPTLSGKLVSIEKVSRKKYLDLAPERIRNWMPDDPGRHREVYHIVYLDPAGRRQSATLESGEFYVPPREPGEEVQVAYVGGDAPQVKGLSRARDSAFLDCFPLAIGVGLLYFAGLAALSLLPRLPRLLRGLLKLMAPKDGVVDPGRPELR